MGAFEDFVNTELPLRTGIAALPTANRYPRFTGVGRVVEERTPAEVLADIGAAAAAHGHAHGDLSGVTSDQHHAQLHAASHISGDAIQNATAGQNGLATAAQITMLEAHSARHQSAGADAIKVDDLASPDDNTDLNVTTSAHGLCPKLPNDAAKFLDGTGAWTAPSVGTIDAKYRKRPMLWRIQNPIVGENWQAIYVPDAATCVKAVYQCVGGTSVEFNIEKRATNAFTAGTNIWTADKTILTASGQQNTSSFDSGSIAADTWLTLDVSAVTGSVTDFIVALIPSID